MSCSKPARTCLIGFNFSFWIIGILLLLIGVWSKFEFANFQNIWSNFYTERFVSAKIIHSLSLLLIFLGVFTSILGLIGCLGAKHGSRSLLTVYLALIIGLFLLEQIAIYFTISFQTRVRSDLNSSLNETLHNAFNNSTISAEAIDNVQRIFSCCGTFGPVDYANQTMPLSCFPDENSQATYFANGCASTIFDFVKVRIPVITAVLFVIIVIEIVALICTICVCTKPSTAELYDLF